VIKNKLLNVFDVYLFNRLMKRVFSIAIVIVYGLVANAQDPQFTQFYANPLYLAPSYAGGIPGHRAALNYRNQWTFVPGTFQTYSVSYDHNFMSFKSGLGLLVLGDYAGDGRLGTTMAGLLYSYDINPHPDYHIRPGIGFYYLQHSIDYSRLIFGDQLAGGYGELPPTVQPLGNNAIRDIDVSTSVLIYSDDVWLGATWDHMLRPERSFYGDDVRTPYKISVYGGGRIVLRGIVLRPIEESITGAFNLRFQGLSKQLDLGLYWYREPFLFGTWYRGIPLVKQYPGTDAVAFLVGYRFQEWSASYSYDFTLSRMTIGSGGSHEIAVIYTFTVKTRKRWRAIPCPTF
jgi:type IX secretion system PorP/SprF family membrane protein